MIAVTTDSPCIESHHQVDAVRVYVLEKDASRMLCVPLHIWVIWEVPAEKQSKDSRCLRRAKPSTVGAKNMASSSGCAITRRVLLPSPGTPAGF